MELEELKEDLGELAVLAASQVSHLERFCHQLRRPEIGLSDTREMLVASARDQIARYNAILKSLANPSEDIETLISLKRGLGDQMRSLQGVTGSLLASLDWQSPSFAHALSSQAGTKTGKIQGTINDYKRDHHLDAKAYEQTFRNAYIDTPFGVHVEAYAVVSGMAAFTTALAAIESSASNSTAPVLVGENCYFENKNLLRKRYGARLRFIDEHNTDEILRLVEELQPTALFLDSWCNTESLNMPDLAALLPRLARMPKRPMHLVLDNSGLGPSFQPLKHLPLLHPRLRLVVIESLNKYHQFGFDRVTGGMVWTAGFGTPGLFGSRMHLGTNIPDASVLSLPEPNRALLDRRLARIGRNAQLLAELLDRHIRETAHLPVSHVVYPGLPSHAAFAWTQSLPFRGGSMTLAFKKGCGWPALYERFLTLAIQEAKKEGLALNAGSSFGLTTSRVYLTARHAKGDAKPFLRISVGTESLEEITALGNVLIRAIDRLSAFGLF